MTSTKAKPTEISLKTTGLCKEQPKYCYKKGLHPSQMGHETGINWGNSAGLPSAATASYDTYTGICKEAVVAAACIVCKEGTNKVGKLNWKSMSSLRRNPKHSCS